MTGILNRSSTTTILFFLALLLVLFLNIKSPFNFYDEGFAVVGSERVMNGEAPYRDFWGIYPPGQFYTIGLLYKIFGANLIVSRVYDTLVRFAIVLGVYFITRRLASRGLALLVGLLVACILAAIGFYAYAVFPALAFGLLAVLPFLTYLETCRKRWLALAGLLTGAASLYRWDIGLYALASMALVTLVFALLRARGRPTWGEVIRPAVRDALVLLGGFLAVGLTGYLLVLARSGAGNLFDQVFMFPLTIFPTVRRMPYPKLLPPVFAIFEGDEAYKKVFLPWLRFYLPLALFGIGLIYYGVRLMLQRSGANTHHLGALLVAIFGSFLFLQGLSRYDYIHVLPASIAAIVLAFALVSHLAAGAGLRLVSFRMLLLPAVLLVFYLFPAVDDLYSAARHFWPLGCYSSIEKAGCVFVNPEQERAAHSLDRFASQEEAIFVGNTRHDKIFVSDVGFYFLAGRPIATRYHELHPGVANTQPVQEEIVRELETTGTRWAVLLRMWESNEPNGSSVSTGVTTLDKYLRANFSMVAQEGSYQVWQRKAR